MYLDAEISDHLDMALLLKTKTNKKKNTKNNKQQTKNYYILGLCMSLDRVLSRRARGFVGFLGGLLLLRMCLKARDGLVCVCAVWLSFCLRGVLAECCPSEIGLWPCGS
jgi:hypothetical protein